MKKIKNKTEFIVSEMLEGYYEANKKDLTYLPECRTLMKKKLDEKVVVLTAGGSGCEPMHLGYVGYGMADATCVGDFFSAPSAYSIYEAGKRVDRGKGIVLVCANFAGDYLNTDMAKELLELDGYKVSMVVVNDDISSAQKLEKECRSGVSGIIFVVKLLGAASELGMSFDDILRLGEKIKNEVYTMPVVLYPGVSPVSGKKLFKVNSCKIEFGMGFNGEPGIRTTGLLSADGIVDIVYHYLAEDMNLKKGDELCVIVNSLGATTYMEQCILYRRLAQLFKRDHIDVFDTKINRYLTSQETGGFSISLLRLDDELKGLYNHPAYSPGFSSFINLVGTL